MGSVFRERVDGGHNLWGVQPSRQPLQCCVHAGAACLSPSTHTRHTSPHPPLAPYHGHTHTPHMTHTRRHVTPHHRHFTPRHEHTCHPATDARQLTPQTHKGSHHKDTPYIMHTPHAHPSNHTHPQATETHAAHVMHTSIQVI